MTNGPGSRAARGLVMCPWGCGQVVRRTRNNNARNIYIEIEPDEAGRIAAWDPGGVWRSRQLHKGEAPVGRELLYMIHNAKCWVLLRRNGVPARPSSRRPAPVAPPPAKSPPNPETLAQLRADLDAVRTRGPAVSAPAQLDENERGRF